MFRNLVLRLSDTAAFSILEKKKSAFATSFGEVKSQQDLWRLHPLFLPFSYRY